MALEVKRLGNTFFAEVRGVDLRREISDNVYNAINKAMLDHGVLLFPDQPVSDAEQERFSKGFGPLEVTFEDPEYYVAHLSNLNQDGSMRSADSRKSTFLRANQQWHSDSTMFQAPAKYSFLSAHAVAPEGGETEWADMQGAWDALTRERREQLDGLIISHDFQKSRRGSEYEFDEEERSQWPPLSHPLVRVHEETGRKVLYLGSLATHVVGWPDEKGRALIEELLNHATQEQFVHTHKWNVNDFMMWDNRRVIHRGRPWDEEKFPRDLRRTTVKGTGPTMINGEAVNEYERAQSAA